MNVFEFTLPILTAHTTQIFKHLIKLSHHISKKRSSKQRKEDLETIRNVESLETHFVSHSTEILKFLFSHSNKVETIEAPDNDGEFTEEMLIKFVAMKASDLAEKLPSIIGPKNVSFAKVNFKQKELPETEPEEEKINDDYFF
jgi:hypothetical protein